MCTSVPGFGFICEDQGGSKMNCIRCGKQFKLESTLRSNTSHCIDCINEMKNSRISLFVSYHYTSKFGSRFGNAVIENPGRMPTSARDIDEIKYQIMNNINHDFGEIVIINIVELKG